MPLTSKVSSFPPSIDLLESMQRWRWGILLFWTFVSAIGLFFDVRQETNEAEESARIEVRAHFDEHVLIRSWAARHGGVYAPIDPYTLPNPFLEGLVEERDIQTPGGVKLTLINPAYVTRQLLELGKREEHTSITHLTSLNPINPINAPDEWEKSALQRFESGKREFSSIGEINGQSYMRLMRPLMVEKPCLKCHAQQGYKEGDVRGGISIAVPMKPHIDVSRQHTHRMMVIHSSLWLLGMFGIWFGMRRFMRRIRQSMELQNALHKLSSALEQAGEAVLITDHRGYIEYTNKAFEELSGWPASMSHGRTPRFLRPRNDDPWRFRQMWHRIQRGKVWQQEQMIRTRKGKLLHTLVSVSPIYAPEELAHPCNFVCIIRDISRETELEISLRQMQKMESLGVLVGGIAHDFNNVLAGILGHLYLAKTSIAEHAPAMQALNKAETLGFRASSMISQLLAFARRDQVSMQVLEFTPFFKEAVKLAQISIPENIRVNSHVHLLTPACVYGDPTQLQQIIMNLLNNARDALVNIKQPHIDISLSLVQVDDYFIQKYRASNDTYLLLQVQDNGSGIDPDHLENIFEPFFTTKPQGKGTGLGLAMVYGAVRTHGGVIEVKSQPNQGSCFNIYLPIHDQPAEHSDSPSGHAIAQGKQESILLVDDDENLREALAELLRSFNYTVQEAADGKQAVAAFFAHRKSIDLVILDVIMPGMGGFDAARDIRAIRPHVPLLFITGYDYKVGEHKELPFKRAGLLTKPFDIVQLSHTLRQLIEATAGGDAHHE